MGSIVERGQKGEELLHPVEQPNGTADISQPLAKEMTTVDELDHGNGHDMPSDKGAIEAQYDKITQERDPTLLPILITDLNNNRGVIQAKIDTGADANFITYALVEKLRRFTGQKLDLEPFHKRTIKVLDEDRQIQHKEVDNIRTFGDGHFVIENVVHLSFLSRADLKPYNNVEFEVVESRHSTVSNPSTPSENQEDEDDGGEDILFGAPWLMREHVLQIDEKFDFPIPAGASAIEGRPAPDHKCVFWSNRTKSGKAAAHQPSIVRPPPPGAPGYVPQYHAGR